MATVGTAFLDVKPDLSSVNRDMSGSKLSGIGKKAGLALAAGIGVGLVALGKLVKESIGAASDLGESINKTKVVFGDSGQEIIKWSRDTADSMGIAQSASLEAAGGFGAMFIALGMGEKPSAKMSKSLVGLAADMASLHNQDPTEMLDKLRAGMSGEMEPLKRFGIVLSEAAVATEAVEAGIVKVSGASLEVREAQLKATEAGRKYEEMLKAHGEGSLEAQGALIDMKQAQKGVSEALEAGGSKLTDVQKIQARYSLLMKQSATAQGDFANTANSLPNIQRRLNATWTDLTATLGKAFLPVLEDLGKKVLDFSQSRGFQNWLKDASKWLEDELPGAIDKTVKGLGWIRDHVKEIAVVFAGLKIARITSGVVNLGSALAGLAGRGTATAGGARVAGGGGLGVAAVGVAGLTALWMNERLEEARAREQFEKTRDAILDSDNAVRSAIKTLGKLPESGKNLQEYVATVEGAGSAYKVLQNRISGSIDRLEALNAPLDTIQQANIDNLMAQGRWNDALALLNRFLKEARNNLKPFSDKVNKAQRDINETGGKLDQFNRSLERNQAELKGSGSQADTARGKFKGLGTEAERAGGKRVNIPVTTPGAPQALAMFRAIGDAVARLGANISMAVTARRPNIPKADSGGVFKGPGLVAMGAGHETFASGLRPAEKVSDVNPLGSLEGMVFKVDLVNGRGWFERQFNSAVARTAGL